MFLGYQWCPVKSIQLDAFVKNFRYPQTYTLQQSELLGKVCSWTSIPLTSIILMVHKKRWCVWLEDVSMFLKTTNLTHKVLVNLMTEMSAWDCYGFKGHPVRKKWPLGIEMVFHKTDGKEQTVELMVAGSPGTKLSQAYLIDTVSGPLTAIKTERNIILCAIR